MINQKDKGAQQGRKVAKPSKRKLYQYLVDQYVESIYRYDEDICRIDNFLNIPLEKHAKSLDKQFRILSEYSTLCETILESFIQLRVKVLSYDNPELFPMEKLVTKQSYVLNLKSKLDEIFEPIEKKWHTLVKKYNEIQSSTKGYHVHFYDCELTQKNIERVIGEHKVRMEEIRKKREAKDEKRLKKQVKEQKIKERWMSKNCPKLEKVIDDVTLFIQQNKNVLELSLMQLQKLKKDIDEKFIALSSIKEDMNHEMLSGENIHTLYHQLFKELNDFSSVLSKEISIKGKTNQQKLSDKQKVNKNEDLPFFRKMTRLVERDFKSDTFWYENESRKVNVSLNESIDEYMQAYGRTIRGGLRSANIVYVGQEDVDQWGYIELSDKFVPFSIREIKQSGNYTLYHVYTFKTTENILDYDFDSAITDRIIMLNEKGIQT